VEVETDSISATQDIVTPHDINYIKGSSTTFIGLGFNFNIIETTKTALKAFATAKNFSLDLIDGAANSVTSLVSATALSITNTSPITGGTQNTPYTYTLTKAGGSGKFTWTIDSGTLQAGLTLSTAGIISGTPTATGAAVVVYKVTDSFGQVATKSLSLTIS
jgi:hypothetical protein